MITLEEYKKALISCYSWPCDAGDEKQYQRSINLATHYKNQLLQRIIDDTYSFVDYLFNTTAIDDGFYAEKLEEDISFPISLGLTGGHKSDYIYVDSNDHMISKYIMKEIFNIDIYVDEDMITYEVESNDEYDVMSFDRIINLYINGFPENINEIKRNFYKDKKVLVKK